MATATIQLPEDIKRIADDRAVESGFADASEYVRALILADTEQPITPEMEEHLMNALKTPAIEVTPQLLAEKHRKLTELHRKGQL